MCFKITGYKSCWRWEELFCVNNKFFSSSKVGYKSFRWNDGSNSYSLSPIIFDPNYTEQISAESTKNWLKPYFNSCSDKRHQNQPRLLMSSFSLNAVIMMSLCCLKLQYYLDAQTKSEERWIYQIVVQLFRETLSLPST